MTNENYLIICGENISKIGKKIGEYRLGLQDFRDYYSQLIKVYNQFIEINKEYLSNLDKDSDKIKKKIIVCEIKAWDVYVSFKKNKRESIKDLILFSKYYHNRKSDYRKKSDEIVELRKEIRNPNNILENEEKLEKFRRIGQLYDELSEERIIKDPLLFWTIIGVILTAIYIILTLNR